MELTEGILKSIDSGIQIMNHKCIYYALRYKGKLYSESSNVRLFKKESAAKAALTKFVRSVFWFGEMWQSDKIHKKNHTEIDFSETIKMVTATRSGRLRILAPGGEYETDDARKLYKEISDQLLADGIFTIEKID